MPDVRLHLGDCLDVMGGIEPGSVDLILADLPYGTTACKWDTVIPFAPLWAHYRRLLKPRGAVVLTASQPFTSALVMSNPGWFKYEWVWEKDNGTNFFNAKHQPFKVHENVVVFSAAASSHSPNPTMTYNPQVTPGRPYKAVRKQTGKHVYHVSPAGDKQDNPGFRYPRTVQKFNAERGLHETQKPVALMEYLVSTYTHEGELVLDNVFGSCTTGIACVNTGRKFVGIEKDPDIFTTAEARIATAQRDRAELLIA